MAEDHGCAQVGIIAELKTTLKNQRQADERIEENLEKLTDEVRKNQEQNQAEFKQINATLITLKDSADAQQQSISDLRDDVRHYTDSLNTLYGRVGKVEGTVSDNTTNIRRLDDNHKDITKRVDSLEKTVIKITVLAGAMIAIIEFIANFSSIVQMLFPDRAPVRQVQQVQPQQTVHDR